MSEYGWVNRQSKNCGPTSWHIFVRPIKNYEITTRKSTNWAPRVLMQMSSRLSNASEKLKKTNQWFYHHHLHLFLKKPQFNRSNRLMPWLLQWIKRHCSSQWCRICRWCITTCTRITPPATMVEAVDADMVTAEMVVDVVEDVLKVVAAVIVTRMVTATIWEKIFRTPGENKNPAATFNNILGGRATNCIWITQKWQDG